MLSWGGRKGRFFRIRDHEGGGMAKNKSSKKDVSSKAKSHVAQRKKKRGDGYVAGQKPSKRQREITIMEMMQKFRPATR